MDLARGSQCGEVTNGLARFSVMWIWRLGFAPRLDRVWLSRGRAALGPRGRRGARGDGAVAGAAARTARGCGVAMPREITKAAAHLADAGPRLFGYTFNPLSAYFCYSAGGELALIIYE